MIAEAQKNSEFTKIYPQDSLSNCIRQLKNFDWPEGYALLPVTCAKQTMWMVSEVFFSESKIPSATQQEISAKLGAAQPSMPYQVLPIFLYDSNSGRNQLSNCLVFIFEQDLETRSQFKKITLIEAGRDFNSSDLATNAVFQQQICCSLRDLLGRHELKADSFAYLGDKATYSDALPRNIRDVLMKYFYPRPQITEEPAECPNAARYTTEVVGTGVASILAGVVAAGVGATAGPISAAVGTTLMVGGCGLWAYEGTREKKPEANQHHRVETQPLLGKNRL